MYTSCADDVTKLRGCLRRHCGDQFTGIIRHAMAFSLYAQGLDSGAKARYQSKIVGIGLDPYTIRKEEQKSVIFSTIEELPDLAYNDIYNYFVNTPSYITGQALKAYKSMEAYKYFTSGFVRDILVCLKQETFIITSKVCILFLLS